MGSTQKKAFEVIAWYKRLKLEKVEEDGEYIYRCPACFGVGGSTSNWVVSVICRVCLGDGTVKLFLCEGCGEWVPWSEGAADDCPNYCDDCANNVNEGKPV